MLNMDSASDAVPTEHMFAGCDNGVVRVVIADCAFLLAFDVQTKSLLKKATVFVVEGNYLMLVE